MHKRKIKRKGKFLFLKIIFPIALVFMVLTGLYFYFPMLINGQVISPLSSRIFKSDRQVISENLNNKKISFSSIEVLPGSSYVVKLSGGGQAIVTSHKNIESQISSLQLMLGRLTIEGKSIKTVDFRFDRPVIRL